MDYFRQYLIVGGMPQAVKKYIDTKSFERTDLIKRDILDLYLADVRKYARGFKSKVMKIFDTIPEQLQKHEKNSAYPRLSKEQGSGNMRVLSYGWKNPWL